MTTQRRTRLRDLLFHHLSPIIIPRLIPRMGAPQIFDRVDVSVVPATGEKAAEHVILVFGFRKEADGEHMYVLEDLSMHSPKASDWVNAAVKAYHAWAPAAGHTWISVETNTGGVLLESMIRAADSSVNVRTYQT